LLCSNESTPLLGNLPFAEDAMKLELAGKLLCFFLLGLLLASLFGMFLISTAPIAANELASQISSFF